MKRRVLGAWVLLCLLVDASVAQVADAQQVATASGQDAGARLVSLADSADIHSLVWRVAAMADTPVMRTWLSRAATTAQDMLQLAKNKGANVDALLASVGSLPALLSSPSDNTHNTTATIAQALHTLGVSREELVSSLLSLSSTSKVDSWVIIGTVVSVGVTFLTAVMLVLFHMEPRMDLAALVGLGLCVCLLVVGAGVHSGVGDFSESVGLAFLFVVMTSTTLALKLLMSSTRFSARLGWQRSWAEKVVGALTALPFLYIVAVLPVQGSSHRSLTDVFAVLYLVMFGGVVGVMALGRDAVDKHCSLLGNSRWQVQIGSHCDAELLMEVWKLPDGKLKWQGAYNCLESTDDSTVHSYRFGVIRDKYSRVHDSFIGAKKSAEAEGSGDLVDRALESEQISTYDARLVAPVFAGMVNEEMGFSPSFKHVDLAEKGRSSEAKKAVLIEQVGCQGIRVHLLQEAEGGEIAHKVMMGNLIEGKCEGGFESTGKKCAHIEAGELGHEQPIGDDLPTEGDASDRSCSEPTAETLSEGQCHCAHSQVAVSCAMEAQSCQDTCRRSGLPAPLQESIVAEMEFLDVHDGKTVVVLPLWSRRPVRISQVISPSHLSHELHVLPVNPVRVFGNEFSTQFRTEFVFKYDTPMRMQIRVHDPFGAHADFHISSSFCALDKLGLGLKAMHPPRQFGLTTLEFTVGCAVPNTDHPDATARADCEAGHWTGGVDLLCANAVLALADRISPGQCPFGYQPFNHGNMCCRGVVDTSSNSISPPCAAKDPRVDIVPCPWRLGCHASFLLGGDDDDQ